MYVHLYSYINITQTIILIRAEQEFSDSHLKIRPPVE